MKLDKILDLKEIKIMGLTWKIKYETQATSTNNTYGTTNYENKEIYISDHLNLESKREVLLHELFHAIYWSMGLDTFQPKELDEEKIVTILSRGLYEIIVNNQ